MQVSKNILFVFAKFIYTNNVINIPPYNFQSIRKNWNTFGNDWEVPDPERDHPYKDRCKVDEDPKEACDPDGFTAFAEERCSIIKNKNGEIIFNHLHSLESEHSSGQLLSAFS